MAPVSRLLAALTVVLPSVYAVLPAPNSPPSFVSRHRRHLAAAPPANTTSTQPLAKRGFSGRATYYEAGLGACGWTNTGSDYIVALNQGQYGDGQYCGKGITISYGGKSAHATIADMCPGCPWGALDLTSSLFQHFSDLSAGVFYATWSFDGQGGGGGGGGKPQESTSSSYSYYAAPTHSSTTWSSWSSWSKSSSSAWSSPSWSPSAPSSSASSSTSSSTPYSSYSASSSSSGNSPDTPQPTSPSNSGYSSGGPIGATSQPDGTQSEQAYEEGGNLNTLNQALLGLASLVVAGAQVTIQQVSI